MFSWFMKPFFSLATVRSDLNLKGQYITLITIYDINIQV